MHRHLDCVHPIVVHHVLSDLTGDRFDQIAGRTGDDGGRALGQDAIVVGVCQVVAGRRIRQIDPHDDIDDEILPVGALMIEHPVSTANCQAAQLDSISHQILPPQLASTPRRP